MRLTTNSNTIADEAAPSLLFERTRVWRRLWPAAALLVFALPLPHRLEIALAGPLQSVGMSASTYLLQTFGYPAVAEGPEIVVQDTRVSVTETFSGLRMLVPFFAISSAVALCISRPKWEHGLVVASALPVAIACCVARVSATVMVQQSVGNEAVHKLFHNVVGWLMLPLAAGLLFGELWILSRLLIAPPERDVVPVGSRRRANA